MMGALINIARDGDGKISGARVIWTPITGKDLDAAAGFVPLSKPQPGEQPKSVFPRQAMRNDWGGFR